MSISVREDVGHIQQHYQDFFESFQLQSMTDASATFIITLAEEDGNARRLTIERTPVCFQILSDDGMPAGSESCKGEAFESIEQLLNRVAPRLFQRKMQQLTMAKLAKELEAG
ncbi:unnamed protein product [Vitrella brassicaformis CCMP3155]|uniref:GSKIP domain-containing protein n=1 Tax=Vitrella brassicaformis (strain CCMP3155) TaxID=1169540 RepID=A0A0G4EWQ7_VITBC|nr:unnamed protein product [Vitrella brassicaformis CCMP3155]|eukprot:CEM03183.1 unnamed protein product [Vitrella brassicaformis CCMP3155]